MFCTKCGQEIKPGTKFCVKCGTPVTPVVAPMQQNTEANIERKKVEKTEKTRTPEKSEKPEKQKNPLVLVLVGVFIVLLLICGVLGAYYVMQTQGSSRDTRDSREEKESETSRETEQREDGTEAYEAATEESGEPSLGVSAEAPATEEAEIEREHQYQIVVQDVTWSEAYQQACSIPNGHLVTFETQEEMDMVLAQINDQGYGDYIFWIGAACGGSGDDYFWVYKDGEFGVDSLMGNANWLEGEPTFYDSENDLEEFYVDMFYSKSAQRWVWNDVPDDLISLLSYYSGKLAYVVEIE